MKVIKNLRDVFLYENIFSAPYLERQTVRQKIRDHKKMTRN